MKYLIGIIIIGAIIWGIFSLLNPEVSVTLTSEDTSEEFSNSSAKKYLTSFKSDISLPNKNIYVYPVTELVGNKAHAFMRSKLSKDEFLDLIEQLGLNSSPNLFEFWPNVFTEDSINKYLGGWDVTNKANEYTYYGKSPTKQIEMAAKYENDKMFLRTRAMIRVNTDEKGYLTGIEVLERK